MTSWFLLLMLVNIMVQRFIIRDDLIQISKYTVEKLIFVISLSFEVYGSFVLIFLVRQIS